MKDSRKKGTAVLSETIRKLVNDGRTTVTELAEIGGLSDTSVSRYHVEDVSPRFDTVRQWVRHHRDIEVKLAFVRCLIAGTTLTVEAADENSLDIDCDGAITDRDAIKSLHSALENLSAQLRCIDQSMQDGKTNDAEMVELEKIGGAAITAIKASLRVLEEINQRGNARRKARPLSHTA